MSSNSLPVATVFVSLPLLLTTYVFLVMFALALATIIILLIILSREGHAPMEEESYEWTQEGEEVPVHAKYEDEGISNREEYDSKVFVLTRRCLIESGRAKVRIEPLSLILELRRNGQSEGLGFVGKGTLTIETPIRSITEEFSGAGVVLADLSLRDVKSQGNVLIPATRAHLLTWNFNSPADVSSVIEDLWRRARKREIPTSETETGAIRLPGIYIEGGPLKSVLRLPFVHIVSEPTRKYVKVGPLEIRETPGRSEIRLGGMVFTSESGEEENPTCILIRRGDGKIIWIERVEDSLVYVKDGFTLVIEGEKIKISSGDVQAEVNTDWKNIKTKDLSIIVRKGRRAVLRGEKVYVRVNAQTGIVVYREGGGGFHILRDQDFSKTLLAEIDSLSDELIEIIISGGELGDVGDMIRSIFRKMKPD